MDVIRLCYFYSIYSGTDLGSFIGTVAPGVYSKSIAEDMGKMEGIGFIDRVSNKPVPHYRVASYGREWLEKEFNEILRDKARASEYLSLKKFIVALNGFPGWVPLYIATEAHYALIRNNKTITPTSIKRLARNLPSISKPKVSQMNAALEIINKFTKRNP